MSNPPLAFFQTALRRNRWHAALLALLTVGLCLCWVSEPGWGDELQYWCIGFRLHDLGLAGWPDDYHSLRWPVWGVCWLLQGLFGYGVASYTGEAVFYMAAGAAAVYALGWQWLRSRPAAWACGIAFIFHPLLNTVCNAPWPDLSEGVWGAGAMLCWWRLVWAQTRRSKWGWALLTAACVTVLEANRLTGVFIVPVLVAATLLFFRRRFGWLLVAGLGAAVLYLGEMTFYHWRFHDWLHDLHANLEGKGSHGTGPVPLLTMPFRFFSHLWFQGALAPFYCVLGLLGCWVAWRDRLSAEAETPPPDAAKTLGGVLVLWLGVLYLEYACAPQSLSPWRPVVREGGRFIGSLVVPLSILAVGGLLWIFRRPWLLRWPAFRWPLRFPAALGALIVGALLVCSFRGRPPSQLGYLTGYRAYLKKVPAGTMVFTHEQMRCLAFMADPKAAARLRFSESREFLRATPLNEKLLAAAQECWYVRRLIWRPERKISSENFTVAQAPLLSSLASHEQDWRAAEALTIRNIPDVVFLRRRSPEAPAAQVLAPEQIQLVPPLPLLPIEWKQGDTKERTPRIAWTLPPAARGAMCRAEFQLTSKTELAANVEVFFSHRGKTVAEYHLQPFAYTTPHTDFLAFRIPTDADGGSFRIKFSKRTQKVTLDSLRLVLDPIP